MMQQQLHFQLSSDNISLPYISIIVPSYNEERRIADCIASIKNQDYPENRFELIIVDGGSRDRTASIAHEMGCNVATELKRGRAAACNRGIALSRGDIVAFTDADCVLPSNWLREIARVFQSLSDVAIVGGPSRTPESSSDLAQAAGFLVTLFTWVSFLGVAERVVGCNCAYRKATIAKVGGFDESLPTAEEIDLHHRVSRAGFHIRWNPSMFVWHYRRETVRKFVKQQFRFGLGRGLQVRNDRSSLKPTNVLSIVYLIAIISTILAADFFGWWAFIYLMGFSAIGLLLTSIVLTTENKSKISLIPYAGFVLLVWYWTQTIGFIDGLALHKK